MLASALNIRQDEKNAFGDIDSMAEQNGHFLFLEWKDHMGGGTDTGQMIAFRKLTELSPKISFLFVVGDAESMEATSFAIMKGGVLGTWASCDFSDVWAFVRNWRVMTGQNIIRPKDELMFLWKKFKAFKSDLAEFIVEVAR
jgi:hypothetical protein